ncbi:GNAT family N-acetyltransferase [Rhizobiales bacterium]|uniref:GNAT family N-acetyltransferase n=1 Tax=Hongsoonwoonella zoysiae TaxID=2821844 RepID=UPI00155F9CAA|nr:GNAT family N-acetyltransferase [Hongsoonwoonella zoysiae]NRG17137.1 GNAT family N-acetyltransferase [Hongsoonwoonella zoysiae]
MSTDLIATRPARPIDAETLSTIHLEAWRGAYRGLLSGVDLERMISRRGPRWWRGALSRGVLIQVLEVAGKTVGYATYGRSRMRELPFEGEIYELYILPEYQGLGFGTKLFQATRRALVRMRLSGATVRVLSENEAAMRFYRSLGGQLLMNSQEQVAGTSVELSVFGWFADSDAS